MFCWKCKHRKKTKIPTYGDHIPIPECTLPPYYGDESLCPYFEAERILEGDIWFSEEDKKKREEWMKSAVKGI